MPESAATREDKLDQAVRDHFDPDCLPEGNQPGSTDLPGSSARYSHADKRRLA